VKPDPDVGATWSQDGPLSVLMRRSLHPRRNHPRRLFVVRSLPAQRPSMRPDLLERRLRESLDALGPAPGGERSAS
jgi:hypothetical protein